MVAPAEFPILDEPFEQSFQKLATPITTDDLAIALKSAEIVREYYSGDMTLYVALKHHALWRDGSRPEVFFAKRYGPLADTHDMLEFHIEGAPGVDPDDLTADFRKQWSTDTAAWGFVEITPNTGAA